MATIALLTSTAFPVPATVTNSNVSLEIVGIPVEQLTLPVGGTVKAGAPVRINSSNQFVECDGSTAANANAYGIAVRRAVVGQSVTAVRRGILGGFNLSSQAFGSSVYVSDTLGVLGDVAGTSSKIVGFVVGVNSQIRGGTAPKALYVSL